MRTLLILSVVLGSVSSSPAGELTVDGLSIPCDCSVTAIHTAVEEIKGISDLKVDINAGRVTMNIASGKDPAPILKAIADAGFHGRAAHAGKPLQFPKAVVAADKKSNRIKLRGLALCCRAAVVGAQKAVAEVKGLRQVELDGEAGTMILYGNEVSIQAAIDALNQAGFHCSVETAN